MKKYFTSLLTRRTPTAHANNIRTRRTHTAVGHGRRTRTHTRIDTDTAVSIGPRCLLSVCLHDPLMGRDVVAYVISISIGPRLSKQPAMFRTLWLNLEGSMKALSPRPRSSMPLRLVLQSIWGTDAGRHREKILRSIARQRRHEIQAPG